jgi:hypothetical protein
MILQFWHWIVGDPWVDPLILLTWMIITTLIYRVLGWYQVLEDMANRDERMKE